MKFTNSGRILAAVAVAGMAFAAPAIAETTLRIGTVLAPDDPMGR